MGNSAVWNVGSYQVSGIPYATASLAVPPFSNLPLEINFPFVTRFFTVRNDGNASIRVGFSPTGIINNNYIYLEPGISYEGELKVSKLYFLSHSETPSSASCIAGLTTITLEDKTVRANWSGSIWGAGIG